MTRVGLRRRRERMRKERIRKARLKLVKTFAGIVFLFAVFNVSLNALGLDRDARIESGSIGSENDLSHMTSENSDVLSDSIAISVHTDSDISPQIEIVQDVPGPDNPEPSSEVPLEWDIQNQAIRWSEEYGVPYSMVLAVIEAESSFDAEAVNSTCFGYMQINSILQDWLCEEIGVYDITDPLQNIHAGIFILGDFYSKYGDWNRALMCYNAGEQGAKDYYFNKGLTSSSYSEKVIQFEKKWAEVLENGR